MKHMREVDNPSDDDLFFGFCAVFEVANIKNRGLSSKDPIGVLSDIFGQRGR